MITNSEFVSRVINGVKAITKDDHISRRYVLSIGRNKCTTYIAQKLTDRTLFREGQLYTHIPCFELRQVEVKKCPFLEFRMCRTLMQSKEKLPKLLHSRYGEAILRVASMDDGVEFSYAPLVNITGNLSRPFAHLANYYYVKDGYLFIPEQEVEAVELAVLTLDKKTANDISGCGKYDKCHTIWDYEFVCPDKILEPIIAETINEVLSTNRRVPADENPNLDNNQKTQTKQ